jgi:hypothetical protein
MGNPAPYESHTKLNKNKGEMDCKDQVEEDCNLILKDWLTESLVTVRNLFNNDSMIRDCLHDFLGDIDQKSCVPGDVSYIEFKPHHVINGDKGSL